MVHKGKRGSGFQRVNIYPLLWFTLILTAFAAVETFRTPVDTVPFDLFTLQKNRLITMPFGAQIPFCRPPFH